MLNDHVQEAIFTFPFYVYCEPLEVIPAHHRATQARLEVADTLIQKELGSGQFDPQDADLRTLGYGEKQYTRQHYARSNTIEPPRRLTNPTARQLQKLDSIKSKMDELFEELYPNNGKWAYIEMILNNQVVNIPVNIQSLRDALGLPHTDLRLPGNNTLIMKDSVENFRNLVDNDHSSKNDLNYRAESIHSISENDKFDTPDSFNSEDDFTEDYTHFLNSG
ncbi:hypothetical protein BC833DRAFT_626713 [Globomyces pollinis-pini]|nr:hypothetical protein BC833DRAFT_626713 [Globomyces pollinis-pini]